MNGEAIYFFIFLSLHVRMTRNPEDSYGCNYYIFNNTMYIIIVTAADWI